MYILHEWNEYVYWSSSESYWFNTSTLVHSVKVYFQRSNAQMSVITPRVVEKPIKRKCYHFVSKWHHLPAFPKHDLQFPPIWRCQSSCNSRRQICRMMDVSYWCRVFSILLKTAGTGCISSIDPQAVRVQRQILYDSVGLWHFFWAVWKKKNAYLNWYTTLGQCVHFAIKWVPIKI